MQFRSYILLLISVFYLFCANALANEKWVNISSENKLWTQSFGDPKKPTVLLIAGAGASGNQWGVPFCETIARSGYHVIRYDHRDVGFSSKFDYKKTPYTLKDLTQDALLILKEYDVDKAHVVGLSMGGYIAQFLAIEHPEQVSSFTSISSTPYHALIMAAMAGQPLPESDLPGPAPQILEAINSIFTNPAGTENEKLEQMLKFVQVSTGEKTQIDKGFWEAVILDGIKREGRLDVSSNHIFAQNTDLRDRRPLLNKVAMRGLVIHGSEDPFFPLPHGKATQAAIPNSSLLEVDGMGHFLDPSFWPIVTRTMINHFNTSELVQAFGNFNKEPSAKKSP